jgi:hypothetical protein
MRLLCVLVQALGRGLVAFATSHRSEPNEQDPLRMPRTRLAGQRKHARRWELRASPDAIHRP